MGRALILALLLLGACGEEQAPATQSPAAPAPREPAAPADDAPRRKTLTLPGGELTMDFVEVARADGNSFWIATTETPWEVFDLFFLRPEEEFDVDGITGPSKSVFPVTRGYGHDGMPALGMTFHSAQSFCTWLNLKMEGHSFRLPTVEEWRLAAGPDPAAAGAAGSPWDAVAWHKGNADGKPHAVATLAPNALGLHDTAGNLAEWVVSAEQQPLALGGSWQQGPGELGRDARLQYELSWQQRDPQWPKSSWWMSDAGFVGIRLVAEDLP